MNSVKRFELILALAAVLAVTAGCGKEQRFTAVQQTCKDNLSSHEALDIARDVLGRMNFTIDKLDAESGYIRTRPLPAAQFFEFWRDDTIGKAGVLEANLHTIRRTVEINITKQTSGVCVECRVGAERLSVSDFEEKNQSDVYSSFSNRQIKSHGRNLVLNASKKVWIDLGPDARLETKILKRIESETAKQ